MVSTAGGIVIAVVVILVGAAVGWIVFTQMRARRLGQPPPSLSSYLPWHSSNAAYGPPRPAAGGVVGWFNDQVRKFQNRNNRSAAGAFEPSGAGTAGRRGFGPLDPDEAWDTRVGHEADQYGYYEPTELEEGSRLSTEYQGGNTTGGGGRAGSRYDVNLAATPGPYGGGGSHGDALEERGRSNPFDDDNVASLRGVSPRPIDTSGGGGARREGGMDSAGSSPSERRSVFRENV